MDREAVLAATLAEWRRGTFVPGQTDCLLSCADYARTLTGIDVGAHWRGSYTTEAQAMAIVASYGSAAILLGGALRLAGFEPVDKPEAGDVVVIRIGQGEFGGLCVGSQRVALRLPKGVLETRVRDGAIVGAWRCPR